ncbi:hypothetical protein BKH46_03605 [Helicobacter sp. 12S02634-8]|uniref:hypothetical protein n=1 Tax=Helicobacter sp. 12S02634-8 TaxID=1476199 RepID=UPI000BA71AE9|nr:hypothetical protein [Helicobacter sp. 12S02634-8]PAF47524.1 hypothetical protein BKH46_03605 [Helicobacter sp. 12S02634-8]
MVSKKRVDVVLIAVDTPIKCGIYEDLTLKMCFERTCKVSDGLLEIFSGVFAYLQARDWVLGRVFYAKGPGSFTALKLTHIFLQTLALSEEIELFSAPSFYFNQSAPIRAFGNKYFIQESSGQISLATTIPMGLSEFLLPERLEPKDFGTQNDPLYILPPI